MMGGGQNRGEIFNFSVTPRLELDPPDPLHAKRTTPPPPCHSCQPLLGAVYCAQYMYLIDYGIKTERACANRNTRLLDFVGYRVRVKGQFSLKKNGNDSGSVKEYHTYFEQDCASQI